MSTKQAPHIEDPRFRLWARINHARDSIMRARDKELAQYNISSRQAAVLHSIHMLDSKATISEIARRVMRQPHSVAGILNRLIKQGLVTKIKPKTRTDHLRFALTEKGNDIFKIVNKRDSINTILSVLSEEDCESVMSCLQKTVEKSMQYIGNISMPPL